MKNWKTVRNNHISGDLLSGSSLRIVFEDKGTDIAYVPSTADDDNGNYVGKVIASAPLLLAFVRKRSKDGDADATSLLLSCGFAEVEHRNSGGGRG